MSKPIIISVCTILFLIFSCTKNNEKIIPQIEVEKSNEPQSRNYKKLPADFNIQKFNEWNVIEQVEFINSLDKDSKISFLSKVLPDSSFYQLPYGDYKFFKDGVIVCAGTLGSFGVAYWEYANNKLEITEKKSKYEIFPVLLTSKEIAHKAVITDIKAEFLERTNKLGITFISNNIEIFDLIYMPNNTWTEIDRFKKTLENTSVEVE